MPDQWSALRTSDVGIQHFCVYVDDIDAATARFEAAGGEMLTGPNPLLGCAGSPCRAHRADYTISMFGFDFRQGQVASTGLANRQ